ncbi:T-cell immunomodulatory protein, partial [Lates japonicus]
DGNFTKADVMPAEPPASFVGQSSFVDFDGDGYQDHLLPVCLDKSCQSSAIYLAKPGSEKCRNVFERQSSLSKRETDGEGVVGRVRRKPDSL